MKLQDTLPRSFRLGRRRYRVDLDFRRVLQMLDILARDDLTPEARDYLALRCVMRRPPRDAHAGVEALRALLFPAARPSADKQKITDFEQDADLIRAAFLQVYGLNLYRDRLHWLEFSALLAGLPEGSRYSEVIGIRVRPMPAPTKWNAAERSWLAKAKAEFAVRMNEKETAQSLESGLRSVAMSLLALAESGRKEGQ